MAKYEVYAEYKDSGVDWLGEIPSHWDLKSSKFLFNIVNGSTPKSGVEEYWEGDITWVTPSDLSKIESFEISESARSITNKGLDSCGTSLVPSGSLILSCRAPIGSLAITTTEVCTNQGCKSLVAIDEINTKFIYYFLSVSTEQLNILGRGTTFLELSSDELGNLKIPFPVVNEAEKIANFLDYETAKIDSLIEKQQQLIQLLKEKRQAVISHAVTKGLNPNVSMKDSGVEWLGEVPEHWNTLPLKLCVQTRKGVAFKAVDFCDAGIRVVKASDIKQKTIRESETFLPNSYVNEFPKAVLHTDDLILSTVGSTPDVKNSAVGQIGKVPQSLSGSLLNQNTVVFSSTEILDQNFLYYLVQTNSYRDHLDLNAHGTANQASLNISDMLNFMISIPELNEQVEIKNYLDKKISKVEELELKILAMSISLNERRTALISAAVTGKIDVRNWQNPTEAKMEFSA